MGRETISNSPPRVRGRGTDKLRERGMGGDGLRAWGDSDVDEKCSEKPSRAERLLDEPLEKESNKGHRSPGRNGRENDHRSPGRSARENGHKRSRERPSNGDRKHESEVNNSRSERPSGKHHSGRHLEQENGRHRSRSRNGTGRNHNEGGRKRARSAEKPATSWIRVDNIPPVAESKHIQHLFTSESSVVLSALVKSGSAFVHFERTESAAQAVKQFNGGEMSGRLIAVELEYAPPQPSPERWGAGDAEGVEDAGKTEKKHKKDKRARH